MFMVKKKLILPLTDLFWILKKKVIPSTFRPFRRLPEILGMGKN